MGKKLLLFVLGIALLLNFNTNVVLTNEQEVHADAISDVDATSFKEKQYTYIDAFGNEQTVDLLAEEAKVKTYLEEKKNMPANVGGTENIKYGVVNFKTKPDYSLNTSFTYADGRSGSGYTNGYYGADGAFLGYDESGSKVKFMLAGTIGWVNASEVEVLDYEDESVVKSVNFYKVENGILYHYGTTDIRQPYYTMVNMIGYKQDYMKDKTPYYSYDGHYFYTTFNAMIDDYKNDVRTNAINPTNPYYNYYQYLSHRSETNVTAEMLDAYVEYVLRNSANKNKAKMLNAGEYFVKYEQMYGSNALMMYGLAANESGWGLSSIAQNKNNLFGHGAVDSNPYYGSNGYESVENCILYHAKIFISEGYLDPKDYSNRYYGAHFGDKDSGVNVKYASDPYWGEKAAEYCWAVYEHYERESDASLHSKDAFKYTIAIQNGAFELNVRKEANASSTALYKSKAISSYPYLVIGEAVGSSVNGNTKWYKIQSDPPLKSDRSAMVQDNGLYDFDKDYAYVSSSYVTIVNEGTTQDAFEPVSFLQKANITVEDTYVLGIKNATTISKLIETLSKNDATVTIKVNENGHANTNNYVTTDMILELTSKSGKKFTYTIVVKGDVNKDGKVSSPDYLIIKDSIMDKYKMSEIQKKAADVNGDKKVSSPDYLMIKDSIMGKIKL